jgi:hypothetical protein
MISFFQLPKRVLHRLDYFRSRFFWQWDIEKKKYRLTKWSVVCPPKDQGGLGVHDLEVKNMALLGKWLARLLTEDGVWQQLLRKNYVGSKAISQVIWKPGDSYFYASIMATKKHFFPFGSFSIRNEAEIHSFTRFRVEHQGAKKKLVMLISKSFYVTFSFIMDLLSLFCSI